MEVQVLASVMHQSNIEDIIQSMRLDSDAVIINQCGYYGYEETLWKGHRIRLFCCAERGVGRSRNNAILRADRDICLFSDEDIVYEEGYAEKIAAEFEKNPAADMILFNIEVEEARRTYHITERKKVRWYNCGRYGAVSFAVKTESLIESGVMFSLLFGGGARYSNGEDSLFLKEFMKKGYQVYTAPSPLAGNGKENPPGLRAMIRNFSMTEGCCIISYMEDLHLLWPFASCLLTGISSAQKPISARLCNG